MKRTILSGVALLALAAPSFAQSTTVTTTTNTGSAGSATIMVEPEQRTRIKQYVVKEKVRPVTVRERITVGATLPADVELETVPTDWGPSLTRYRYVYSNDDIYLVEPSSRRVIQVID